MIRRYIEPSGDEVRDTVPWLWSCRSQRKKRRRRRKGEEGERERKKEEKSAEHGGRLHQRGGHIPGWELLHATFRLYCDLCARWGWLRATIYGFRDEREREREGWSNVGCRMARDRLQRDYKGSSSPRRSIPSSPHPQSFSNAFRIPSSVSILEEDALDGRGLLPAKVVLDVLCMYTCICVEKFLKNQVDFNALSLSSNIFLNIFIDISEPWINAFLLLSFLFCKRNKFYVFYVFKHCTSVS